MCIVPVQHQVLAHKIAKWDFTFCSKRNTGRLVGIIGSALYYRSLTTSRVWILAWAYWRLFHLWLCFITIGGDSEHVTAGLFPWWWWWCFMATFCAQGRLNGNETKSKMKQPSDMPTPGFEHGWWWSVVQHATVRPSGRPGLFPWTSANNNIGMH